MRTDNLCITGNIQLVCLVLAVDNRHHILTLILAGYYVNTLLRTELGLLALGNHFIALTPVQQVAEPVEHLVLCLSSALCRKGIVLVTSPTAREVLAYIAIGYTLGTVHQHLCTIIELRSAIDGQKQ